jgi:peroxiredoxin
VKLGTLTSSAALALAALLPLAALAQEGAAPPPPALAIGDAIPMANVKMKNVDGKELSIADVQGKKGTLVVFSCNACPFAKAWEQRIVDIGNAYPKKGIGVIVINPNDPAKVEDDGYAVMQQRAKQRKMKYPYVVDATSDIARAFGATRTPEAFLFDAQGKLAYHGAVDDNSRDPKAVKETYLVNALQAVTSGGEVALKETKSIGCTIKFRGGKAAS